MKSHGDGTAPTIVRRVREGSVRSRATSPPFAAVVSATTIAIVAFAWTPATTILVDVFVRRDTWLLGVEVVHVALSYLVARFAFGARSPLEAALRLAGGAAALCIANLFMSGWVRQPQSTVSVVGAMFVASLAAGYAVVLVALVWRQGQAHSDESADRALARAGVWAALPTVARTLVLLRVSPAPWYAPGVAFSAALDIILPLTLTCLALARMRGRSKWLAAVQSGRLPQWRVVDEHVDHAALPRLAAGKVAGTLFRVHAPEDPFREAEHLEPVATVGAAARRG